MGRLRTTSEEGSLADGTAVSRSSEQNPARDEPIPRGRGVRTVRNQPRVPWEYRVICSLSLPKLSTGLDKEPAQTTSSQANPHHGPSKSLNNGVTFQSSTTAPLQQFFLIRHLHTRTCSHCISTPTCSHTTLSTCSFSLASIHPSIHPLCPRERQTR